MKIYNKIKFFCGLFWCFLGTLNLIMSCLKGFEMKRGITSFYMLCMGVSYVTSSLSKQATMEYLLEEKDERNQLVNLKSRAKGFQITQNFALIFGFIITIYGAQIKQSMIVAIGVSLTFLWMLSLILERCTFCYYEKCE